MLSLKECQDIIEFNLKELKLPDSPENLYDPIRYMLEPEAKRIRPALVLMACNLFSEDVSEAIYPALAIEVFHNFTLMHDDIMDQSDMRRNRPTVHAKWNANIGILSGDAMMIKSYELLAHAPSCILPAIFRLFNQTALDVCEGQQYDMDFEHKESITLEEYLKMVELKTAALLASSLKIGAILGGAGEKDAGILYEYGRNIGIAFQLQDDLLDVYADPALFGKVTGNDIVSNKKTVLLIQALQAARGSWKKELFRWLETGMFERSEKIRHIMDIYNHLDLPAKTASRVKFYHTKALDLLDDISCDRGRKDELQSFTQWLMNRKK